MILRNAFNFSNSFDKNVVCTKKIFQSLTPYTPSVNEKNIDNLLESETIFYANNLCLDFRDQKTFGENIDKVISLINKVDRLVYLTFKNYEFENLFETSIKPIYSFLTKERLSIDPKKLEQLSETVENLKFLRFLKGYQLYKPKLIFHRTLFSHLEIPVDLSEDELIKLSKNPQNLNCIFEFFLHRINGESNYPDEVKKREYEKIKAKEVITFITNYYEHMIPKNHIEAIKILRESFDLYTTTNNPNITYYPKYEDKCSFAVYLIFTYFNGVNVDKYLYSCRYMNYSAFHTSLRCLLYRAMTDESTFTEFKRYFDNFIFDIANQYCIILSHDYDAFILDNELSKEIYSFYRENDVQDKISRTPLVEKNGFNFWTQQNERLSFILGQFFKDDEYPLSRSFNGKYLIRFLMLKKYYMSDFILDKISNYKDKEFLNYVARTANEVFYDHSYDFIEPRDNIFVFNFFKLLESLGANKGYLPDYLNKFLI